MGGDRSKVRPDWKRSCQCKRAGKSLENWVKKTEKGADGMVGECGTSIHGLPICSALAF